jgi:GTPase SAR1 family protein
MANNGQKDEDEVQNLQYKIILLGDGAVGKVYNNDDMIMI